jgi:hypothetical protein
MLRWRVPPVPCLLVYIDRYIPKRIGRVMVSLQPLVVVRAYRWLH